MTDPLGVGPPLPDLFQVETAVEGTVAHVSVVGDVDLSSVRLLEDPVRRLLGEQRISRLVLDLRGTTFLDSTGLRLLLELYGDARQQHWRLIVVRGREAVQRTMEIAGLDRLIEIVDNPARALENDPATE